MLPSSSADWHAVGSSSRWDVAALRSEFSTMHAVTLARFEKLETALANGSDKTRRFMRVLYEDILSRIGLLGEGRPSLSLHFATRFPIRPGKAPLGLNRRVDVPLRPAIAFSSSWPISEVPATPPIPTAYTVTPACFSAATASTKDD